MPLPVPPPPELSADRWGGRWSFNELALVFSDGGHAAAIALAPADVARLAVHLMEAVKVHEQRHGTLWSEHSRPAGAATDARIRWEQNATPSASGDRLYALLKNLPLNGFERSFKLQPSHLLSHRFLLGLQTTVLAVEDVDFIARAMDAPDDFRQIIVERLAESTFLHFGFEASPEQETLKIYLEFPTGHEAAHGSGHPSYLGFKWAADDTSRQSVSTYSQPVPWNAGTLPDQIATAYRHPLAGDAAGQVIRLALTRAAACALPLVQVTDSDSPRQSFDINLYAADLRVSQVRPLLQPLHRQFGINDADMQSLGVRFDEDLVGHLSGGTDRHGQPFLTIYHTARRS